MRMPTHLARRYLALATMACALCAFPAAGGAAPEPAPATVQTSADTILTNGRIYRVDPEGTWVQALAIRAGKIVAIGTDAEVLKHRGATTNVIDLKGRMAMPGIADDHVHLGAAAAELLAYTCNFSGYSTLDQIIAQVSKCAKEQVSGTWIVGQYWSSKLYGELSNAASLKLLDEASGDHPVMLRNDTIHDRWVNSHALALVGITKSTPSPTNGTIGKDPVTGELNGLLMENAGRLVEAKVPALIASGTPESVAKQLASGIRYLNSQGVTAFADAGVMKAASDAAAATFSDSRSYELLNSAGELTAHTDMCMIVDPAPDSTTADVQKVFADRARLGPGLLKMDCAKIFLDGVQVSRTGYFLDPYLPDETHGANYRGEPKIPQDTLNRLVTDLDRMGISVKIHTAGDGAIRMALDAIEAARKANGDQGPMHTLAHAGYMKAEDFPRAVSLRAAVDASPTIWFPGPVIDGSAAALGPRGYDIFPFKTFTEHNVTVVGGTDWKTLPGEFSSLWDGMEGMVTRKNPVGGAPGALHPEQAIDVATMLKFYTLNSAKVMRLDDRIGSISVGKDADIIVLNQNLFDIDPDKISDTQVDLTMLGGKVVYERVADEDGHL